MAKWLVLTRALIRSELRFQNDIDGQATPANELGRKSYWAETAQEEEALNSLYGGGMTKNGYRPTRQKNVHWSRAQPMPSSKNLSDSPDDFGEKFLNLRTITRSFHWG
jgi:hypothetical protein